MRWRLMREQDAGSGNFHVHARVGQKMVGRREGWDKGNGDDKSWDSINMGRRLDGAGRLHYE